MPHLSNDRVTCRKYLLNAEGYLELAVVFEDRWLLPDDQKQAMVDNAIRSLELSQPHHGDQTVWYLLNALATQLQGQPGQAMLFLNLALQHHAGRAGEYLKKDWYGRQMRSTWEQLQRAVSPTACPPALPLLPLTDPAMLESKTPLDQHDA